MRSRRRRMCRRSLTRPAAAAKAAAVGGRGEQLDGCPSCTCTIRLLNNARAWCCRLRTPLAVTRTLAPLPGASLSGHIQQPPSGGLARPRAAALLLPSVITAMLVCNLGVVPRTSLRKSKCPLHAAGGMGAARQCPARKPSRLMGRREPCRLACTPMGPAPRPVATWEGPPRSAPTNVLARPPPPAGDGGRCAGNRCRREQQPCVNLMRPHKYKETLWQNPCPKRRPIHALRLDYAGVSTAARRVSSAGAGPGGPQRGKPQARCHIKQPRDTVA